MSRHFLQDKDGISLKEEEETHGYSYASNLRKREGDNNGSNPITTPIGELHHMECYRC